MICIKFDQKIKKPKKQNLGLFRLFKGFFKPKKPRFFFEAIFQPWQR